MTIQKKDSFQQIGLMQLGGGAWVFPKGEALNAVVPYMPVYVAHWGYRTEGLKLAWIEGMAKPPHLRNPLVQKAIATGLRNCTAWTYQMPAECKEALVALGNRTQHLMLRTTLVEKIRSAPSIQLAWRKKRDENGWTMSAIGQGAVEAKKFSLATALYPDRYSSYRQLESYMSFEFITRGVFGHRLLRCVT